MRNTSVSVKTISYVSMCFFCLFVPFSPETSSFFSVSFPFLRLINNFCFLVDNANYILTSRGRLKLVHNGFIFYKECERGEKAIWKCSMYYKTHCAARCHTVNQSVLPVVLEHNHPPTFNDSTSKF